MWKLIKNPLFRPKCQGIGTIEIMCSNTMGYRYVHAIFILWINIQTLNIFKEHSEITSLKLNLSLMKLCRTIMWFGVFHSEELTNLVTVNYAYYELTHITNLFFGPGHLLYRYICCIYAYIKLGLLRTKVRVSLSSL